MPYYTVISRRGVFPPPVGTAERAIANKISLYSVLIRNHAKEFLQEVSPHGETGLLRDVATTWGFRVYSLGGIRFDLGWRNQDFPGINYSAFVDRGTGIYGSMKRRIVPREAPFLCWQQNGIWFRARSVAGQRPQYLLNQATALFNDWFLLWLEGIRIDMYRKTL